MHAKCTAVSVPHLVAKHSPYWLLDIGGGTGRIRRVLSDRARYVCLDMEGPKLAQLRRTGRDGIPVQGDATRPAVSNRLGQPGRVR